jgi:hypothetical protein
MYDVPTPPPPTPAAGDGASAAAAAAAAAANQPKEFRLVSWDLSTKQLEAYVATFGCCASGADSHPFVTDSYD